MQALNADAYGVAALALVAGFAFKLIESGAMTKDEVLHLYSTIAQAKFAKGQAYGSAAETDAGTLVTTLAAEIEARF